MICLRNILSQAVICAALGVSGCASFDPNNLILRHGVPQESEVPIAQSTRLAAFEFVWNTIQERYYDALMNGVDWHAARAKYRPLALAADGDDAFWDVLDKMAGELKDSHTRVESPKQVEERGRYENQSLGLGVAMMEGKLVVAGVNSTSDAWWAGVRPGMVIRSIDGENAAAAYQRIYDATRDASTARARHRQTSGKLNRGEPGSSVSMTFEHADGSLFSATLKRRLISYPPQVIARLLPSGIAYLRFSNFLHSLSGKIHAALREYESAPGIIIDLRNNGGGSLEMAKDLFEEFFKDKAAMSKQITRNGKPIALAWGMVEIIKMEYLATGKADAYTGPVAILINPGSASASEHFSAAMQDLGRAKVVGEPSCGCLLGFMGYANIPGGGELAYSEVGFVTPKGRRVEGVGVMPDKLVPLTQADLQVSRDRALEAAQELLKVEAGKNKVAD